MIHPHFNGSDYVHARDHSRLSAQCEDVFTCMRDGQWRTLKEISSITGHPHASVSAQLRHLRKPRFGAHTVEKQYIGNGLFQYRLQPKGE